MIDLEKMKQVLTQYKADFPVRWKKEEYKWIAVKHFQDHWNIEAENFGAMFKEATRKTINLLNSGYTYPGSMICDFAKVDDTAVREMFRALFDESKDLVERVTEFLNSAEEIRKKYDDGTWKNHFQNTNAVSTYLWLRFPDKYYTYKFGLAKAAAVELKSDFIPKGDGTVESMTGAYRMYDEIRAAIKADDSVGQMVRQVLNPEKCYSDPELVTLTGDIVHYLGTQYKQIGNAYSPNLSVQDWSELLEDSEVFTSNSLRIMKRMLDYGGEATCKQLSEKYGEDPNFYNSGSSALAKRIWEKTHCPLVQDADENTKWWPILYFGKKADPDAAGVFVWRLRDELRKALEQADLSSVKLYADGFGPDVPAAADPGFWWLTANPNIWSFSSIKNGEEQSYTLYNDNGNKRRIFQNFLNVKVGDHVICYESNPAKQIVALGRITKGSDGNVIGFKKTEGLISPVGYAALKESSELQDMEFFRNSNGTLFKLTRAEYDFIMDMIRESNPLNSPRECKPYSKKEFLNEVFLDEAQYDDLKGLLLENKNVILQGAPGVGKTFAAKRLAYSIMGKKDDSRIEFVQFHQNYSYEDFVMGYRPNGNGFELKSGVFYRFCKKAANDPSNSYFFIVDEINRGNLSKIFGELLMLIEKDKRMFFGKTEDKEDCSVTLAYTEERFSVPENVHIIGMMNTADRSLAMIDYALRRRFSFFEMRPAFDSVKFRERMEMIGNPTLNELIRRIKRLNEEIESDDSLGSGFQVGHSYFCENPKDLSVEDWLKRIVRYEIVPLLQEYWFDEKSKWLEWVGRLDVDKLGAGNDSASSQTGTPPNLPGNTGFSAPR